MSSKLHEKSEDSFSLQLDESTDNRGNAQLVAFVSYVDTDYIYEHILFCRTLLFQDTDWLEKLCYLADIFSKMNKLKMSPQGNNTSILILYNEVCGFLKKAELWRRA